MNSTEAKWLYAKLKDDDFNVDENGTYLKFNKRVNLGSDIYQGDVYADIDGRVIAIHKGCYMAVVNITSDSLSNDALHGGMLDLRLRAYDRKEVVGVLSIMSKIRQIAKLLNVVQYD